MKKGYLLWYVIVLITLTTSCRHLQNKNAIFQVSTINALMEGVYDGDITYKKLRHYGDFGLGTFNCLDGEMVALNGIFYQIKTDGFAYPVDPSMKTPFAVVTYFKPDNVINLNEEVDYKGFEKYLGVKLPTKNTFYAIKMDGVFKYIKVRTVPKQTKPYPKLAEAVKNQSVFEFGDIEGIIVGFWFPDYVKDINVSGLHIHFLTKDKKKGGHILDCKMQNVKIEIDEIRKFSMILPKSTEFDNADLSLESQTEARKVEKQ